jgi:hypothetical protein
MYDVSNMGCEKDKWYVQVERGKHNLIVVHASWEAINKKLFNFALLHSVLE